MHGPRAAIAFMNMETSKHLSVMLHESVEALMRSAGNVFVDGTFGGGGHTAEIFRQRPEAKVYAFDLDINRIEEAKTRFREELERGQLFLIHANYGDIRKQLADLRVEAVDGVLIDAGVSSFQIDQAERGFSFTKNGPLDMRMDQSQALSAYDVVNSWSQQELERIFFAYGEEKFTRKIVGRILTERMVQPIADTQTLAKLISSCIPRSLQQGIHPATRVFQAIRIAVNGELESLENLLKEIPSILNPGGVLAVISFHSLEDRPVKERLRFLSDACICPPAILSCARCNKPEGSILQRKPFIPSDTEMAQNPRARSAKLRVFIKNKGL